MTDNSVLGADIKGISGNTVKDGSGTELRILVDSEGHIQLDVLTMPTITETNSAAIKNALEIIDDWDDGADRAKVSLEVDNIGLATQTTLASILTDTTAIKNAVQIIDDWDSGDKCKVYLYGDDGGTPRLVQVNASGQLLVVTP